MNRQELEARTKRFALQVLTFLKTLGTDKASGVLAYQLAKSATSIGANYREANRASSHNDFIHKISIVEKEAAETQYWLELCLDGHLGDPKQVLAALDESSQLLAIFTTAGKSAKATRGAKDGEDALYVLEDPDGR